MDEIYICYCGEAATYFARVKFIALPPKYVGRCSDHVKHLINISQQAHFVDTAEELLLLAIEDKLNGPSN
jgi:hypothetical protein